MRSCACCASSAPGSGLVSSHCSGSVVMVEPMASRTASAPRPASGGPFFVWGAAVVLHARQVQQHGKPGGLFHESADA